MLKRILFLISLSALTILSGCRNNQATVKASLNNEFSLAIGQSAVIQEEHLTVKFDGIREDSRCPRGATCIWEGRVSCILQVSDGNNSTELALTEPGLRSQSGQGTYKNYEITSNVQPYPELGKKISSEDYRVLLTIKKISTTANWDYFRSNSDIFSFCAHLQGYIAAIELSVQKCQRSADRRQHIAA